MYRNRSSNQKSYAATQHNVFTTNNFENYDLYYDLYSLIFLISFACHSHVIRMRLCFTYTYAYPIRISFVWQSYVVVCHPYATRMYSSVIRMSPVCTRLSSVCHSYVLVCHPHVLVCHPYVTCMYSYVIRVSLVCTRTSFVCHSYVLVFHPYVTLLWFYYEPYQTVQLAILCQFSPLNDIHLKN